MGTAITTAIDEAGRLVIPKAIREEAELKPGAVLRIEVVDGRIEIVPQTRAVTLVTKGHLRVAVPAEPSEALTAAQVRKTLASIRLERGREEP